MILCPAGPRTCCTGGFEHWLTMRTPTRPWTRHAPGTGRCGLPRATSNCAANASNASPTQPSRVSPRAPEPVPLGCLPCQGPHFSSLPSPELMDFKSRRVSSFRKNLIELAELELKHAKVSPPSSLCPLPASLPSNPRSLGSYQVLASMCWREVVWQPSMTFRVISSWTRTLPFPLLEAFNKWQLLLLRTGMQEGGGHEL